MSLRDTCSEFLSGGTPSTRRQELWSGDIPWITSASLSGLTVSAGSRRISESALRESATRLVPAGNLLVGTRVGVGKSAVNSVDVAINQDLTAGIVRTDRFHPAYLALHLHTSSCQEIFSAQKRGATIKGIPREDLYEIPIAAPPLQEQKAIAAVLLKIQVAVEIHNRLVVGGRELRATTTAKIFREGLRREPLKQTEIGDIPDSWRLDSLGEVARIERGQFTHRPRNDPRFYGGSIPFIQTGDVTKSNGRIRSYSQSLNELGLSVSRVFPKRTIVLTIAANIADTGILEFDSAFPDSLVGITPKPGLDPVFLEYYLRTQKPEMNRLAPKGTQKNINIQFLRPWPVPVPPTDEQQAMAHILSSIDAGLEATRARNEALRSLFSSMLHLLMTGQVRVSHTGSAGGTKSL